ncbi:MAG: PAS domain-containing protein [Alphaproteobacteria bacterium]|nr:PAS domain-containing protein [Alphaproteobacteria bacterium]
MRRPPPLPLPGFATGLLDRCVDRVLAAPGKDRTRGFLARCRPETARVHAIWDELRGGQPVPLRAALDPQALKPYLPGIVIVGVQRDPVDFYYRLIGTLAVTARGGDDTWLRVADAYFAPSMENTIGNYEYVRRSGGTLYIADPAMPERSRLTPAEVLFLPFSLRGDGVDRILAYGHYREIARADPYRTN